MRHRRWPLACSMEEATQALPPRRTAQGQVAARRPRRRAGPRRLIRRQGGGGGRAGTRRTTRRPSQRCMRPPRARAAPPASAVAVTGKHFQCAGMCCVNAGRCCFCSQGWWVGSKLVERRCVRVHAQPLMVLGGWYLQAWRVRCFCWCCAGSARFSQPWRSTGPAHWRAAPRAGADGRGGRYRRCAARSGREPREHTRICSERSSDPQKPKGSSSGAFFGRGLRQLPWAMPDWLMVLRLAQPFCPGGWGNDVSSFQPCSLLPQLPMIPYSGGRGRGGCGGGAGGGAGRAARGGGGAPRGRAGTSPCSSEAAFPVIIHRVCSGFHF